MGLFIICFSSNVMVTEMTSGNTYEKLCAEMRDICNFDDRHPFTMKWVDEEGTLYRRHVMFVYEVLYCDWRVANSVIFH